MKKKKPMNTTEFTVLFAPSFCYPCEKLKIDIGKLLEERDITVPNWNFEARLKDGTIKVDAITIHWKIDVEETVDAWPTVSCGGVEAKQYELLKAIHSIPVNQRTDEGPGNKTEYTVLFAPFLCQPCENLKNDIKKFLRKRDITIPNWNYDARLKQGIIKDDAITIRWKIDVEETADAWPTVSSGGVEVSPDDLLKTTTSILAAA